MQELWFLRFTRRLILTDIHIRFHEDRLYLELFSSYRVDTFFMMDKVPREIIQI